MPAIKRKSAMPSSAAASGPGKLKAARGAGANGNGNANANAASVAHGGATAPAPEEPVEDIWNALLNGFLLRGLDGGSDAISQIPGLEAALADVKAKAAAMSGACAAGKLRHNFPKSAAFEGQAIYSSIGHHDPMLAQSNFGDGVQRWQTLWLNAAPTSQGPYNGELAAKLNKKRQQFIEDQFSFCVAYVERAWETFCDGVRDQTVPGELRTSKKQVSPEEFVHAMLVEIRDHERQARRTTSNCISDYNLN